MTRDFAADLAEVFWQMTRDLCLDFAMCFSRERLSEGFF